ncbi:hypothetical protein HGRIS_014359 [Hohenbuehelia grisea]|uniref:SMAD/FHA domain-containing protein n=1 Tax=Hohenbuehelia grisea TaxID=104357 RepID=A0ABR3JT49_9AGAR
MWVIVGAKYDFGSLINNHILLHRGQQPSEGCQSRQQQRRASMDPVSPHIGTESPPLRTTILGSFLRGRPRNSSQSHINTDAARELSPSPPAQPPSPGAMTGHRRRPAATGGVQTSASQNTNSGSSAGLGLSHMLRRRRSAGNIAQTTTTPSSNTLPPSVAQMLTGAPDRPQPSGSRSTPAAVNGNSNSNTPAHRIRLVPHLDSRRSLRFEAIGRDLRESDPPLRIGRFTDRTGLGLAAVNALGSNKLAFKSKVVSRAHAEIWVEAGGKFLIKDTKSSSGTFLNHVRLSPANTESRPYQIKDGDILQLGVDYQGGAEDIYKSVKIRIELGREWQSAANVFNTNALKNLKSLAAVVAPAKDGAAPAAVKTGPKSNIPDCCICLFGVTIRQALFIAPCSHTFHYKCIRPLLDSHHPAFSCPLCRTFADLEEDVEVEIDPAFEDDDSAVEDGPGPKVVGTPPNSASPVSGTPTNAEPPSISVAQSVQPPESEIEAELDEEMIDVDLRGAQPGVAPSALVADVPMTVHEEEDADVVLDDARGDGDTEGRASPAAGPAQGSTGPADDAMGVDVGVLGVDQDDDVDGTVGGKRKR